MRVAESRPPASRSTNPDVATASPTHRRPGPGVRYEFRAIDPNEAELQRITGLFRVVWPAMCHLTPAYLRWLYADNPRGQVIGFNAWSGGELAGHYAVIPIRALLDGKTVHAALSLNTAVHPDHQGKGLFTRLAEMTYDRAVALGVDHVVGVANANSTPGFVRKLAFESVGRLEARLFWRWPRPAVAGSVAAGRWSRRWDADDLSWRIRNPSARYTVRYHRGTRWILGPTGRPGVAVVLKTDAVQEPERAVLDLPAWRWSPLKLWVGHGRNVAVPPGGGVALPNRLRASPLNLIVRHLKPAVQPLDAESMLFEAIDFDAF